MRKLNKKQKTILLNAYKEGVRNYNIQDELIERLERINLYENLNSDITRFLSDCHMAMLYGSVTLKNLDDWARNY